MHPFLIVCNIYIILLCVYKSIATELNKSDSPKVTISNVMIDLPTEGRINKIIPIGSSYYVHMIDWQGEETLECIYVLDSNMRYVSKLELPENYIYHFYNMVFCEGSLYLTLPEYELNKNDGNNSFSNYKFDTISEAFIPCNEPICPVYKDSVFTILNKEKYEGYHLVEIENKQGKKVEYYIQNNELINRIDRYFYFTVYNEKYNQSFINTITLSKSIYDGLQMNIPDTSDYQNIRDSISATINSTFYENEIVTSFVHKNRLKHIFQDTNGLFIGDIQNGNLSPVYSFPKSLYAELLYSNGYGVQTLTVLDSRIRPKAVMIIRNGKIDLHYIKR